MNFYFTLPMPWTRVMRELETFVFGEEIFLRSWFAGG